MPASSTSTRPRLRDRALARTVPLMPRTIVRRISAPYIAGETLDDAIACVHDIAALGMATTLDVLGESISRRTEAEATRDAYLAAIARLAGVPAPAPHVRNVSVKLSALGLGIDDRLVYDNVATIAAALAPIDGFLRVDMEDTPWTDATIELVRSLREEGHRNVGAVIQSYLRRSRADVEQLAAAGVPLRIVKGIYVEPEQLAFHDGARINRSYLHLCRVLAEAGVPAAFATHDDALIDGCRQIVEDLAVPVDRYEFQMLLGVCEQRRDELVARGHPMRVYVPFGARWYEYSIRRLRENPRVAGHVAAATLGSWRRRVTPGRVRRSEHASAEHAR